MKYPTQKLQEGEKIGVLDTWELIALVLGSGNRNKNVITLAKEVDTLLKNEEKTPTLTTLQKETGLGLMKSCQILACIELSHRNLTPFAKKQITSPEDFLPALNFLKNREQESFVCVTLSAANHILSVEELTKGLVNQAPVHPREAYRHAIQQNAVSVAFAHNHPSGNPEPSQGDYKVTKILIEAGKILGIEVLDHLIITSRGWKSLKKEKASLWNQSSNW